MSTQANLKGQQVEIEGDNVDCQGDTINIGTNTVTSTEVNIGNANAFVTNAGKMAWVYATNGTVKLNNVSGSTTLPYAFSIQNGVQRLRVAKFAVTTIATQAQTIELDFPIVPGTGPFPYYLADMTAGGSGVNTFSKSIPCIVNSVYTNVVAEITIGTRATTGNVAIGLIFPSVNTGLVISFGNLEYEWYVS